MKKTRLYILLLICTVQSAFSQIPTAGELVGIHNVSTTDMNLIAGPITGTLVFNTTEKKIFVFDGIMWTKVLEGWNLFGNSATNSTINFVGTLDAQDLVLKSNNSEKLRLVKDRGQVLVNKATVFNNHPLIVRANGNDVLAFENSLGVPKWHWNLLDEGLNFVETNVADYRLFLKNGGNIGIGTNNPEALLEIESTGVPFKIEPSITVPTGSSGGQMFVSSDDGILYIYDANRNKWLSVDRTMVGWGYNSGNTSNKYLRQFNGADSQNTGWRMIRNGTITAITAQTNINQTWTLQIRKNDNTTAITTLAITSSQGNHATNINVDVNAGDYLQAYCNGSNIDFPEALIEIAWRK